MTASSFFVQWALRLIYIQTHTIRSTSDFFCGHNSLSSLNLHFGIV